MVTDLELKGNELLIYAIIFGFSQDGESKFTGSCSYLCEWTNSSKQSVFRCLKTLCEKGYLQRFENIINGVTLVDYRSTKLTRVVNKVDGGSQQSLLGGSQQSLPHNIELDNIEDNKEDKIVLAQKNNFKKWSLKDFENEILKHRGAATNSQLRTFCNYWSEKDEKDKMKFQQQKTWETSKRISTWILNDDKFNHSKPTQETQKAEMHDAFLNASITMREQVAKKWNVNQ